MKNDIVVARYNEDVSWLDLINKDMYNILIYNKGEKLDRKCIELENIGHESYTYINHIVNNYNNLSDYTIFLQGEPFEHLTNYIRGIKNFNPETKHYSVYLSLHNEDLEQENLISYINNGVLTSKALVDAFHHSTIINNNGVYLCNGLVGHDSINCANSIFIDIPNNYPFEFNCGCQYSISRDLIRNRTKKFYEFVLQKIVENQQFDWHMEGLSGLIFLHPNLKTKI